MQCLILSGGLGTRMRAITNDSPKALLPVGPRAFVEWQLLWLKRLGVEDLVLLLAHGGREVQEHMAREAAAPAPTAATSAWPRVRFHFDGAGPLGTGGAIRSAGAAGLLAERFLVTYGDSFLLFDPKRLWSAHAASGRPVTMSVYENADEGDKSNILFRDGRVAAYDKIRPTPGMRHIDYGMLLLERDWFLARATSLSGAGGAASPLDLADLISVAVGRGEVAACEARQPFHEVGSPEGYQRFQAMMAAQRHDLEALARELR